MKYRFVKYKFARKPEEQEKQKEPPKEKLNHKIVVPEWKPLIEKVDPSKMETVLDEEKVLEISRVQTLKDYFLERYRDLLEQLSLTEKFLNEPLKARLVDQYFSEGRNEIYEELPVIEVSLYPFILDPSHYDRFYSERLATDADVEYLNTLGIKDVELTQRKAYAYTMKISEFILENGERYKLEGPIAPWHRFGDFHDEKVMGLVRNGYGTYSSFKTIFGKYYNIEGFEITKQKNKADSSALFDKILHRKTK